MFVIPDLVGDPMLFVWIPAFAGMTSNLISGFWIF